MLAEPEVGVLPVGPFPVGPVSGQQASDFAYKALNDKTHQVPRKAPSETMPLGSPYVSVHMFSGS